MLNPFSNLHPITVAILILVWGYGSLWIIALRTRALSVMMRPGIAVGDFFLLPLSALLIAVFWRLVDDPIELIRAWWWSPLFIAVAVFLALVSSLRFRHLSLWWVPHVVFYGFMAWVVLFHAVLGSLQITFGNVFLSSWLLWVIPLFLIFLHQILGMIWGKTFPHVGS